MKPLFSNSFDSLNEEQKREVTFAEVYVLLYNIQYQELDAKPYFIDIAITRPWYGIRDNVMISL